MKKEIPIYLKLMGTGSPSYLYSYGKGWFLKGESETHHSLGDLIFAPGKNASEMRFHLDGCATATSAAKVAREHLNPNYKIEILR